MTSDLAGQILIIAFVCLISASASSQNITNTLPPGGKFIVKDASNNYLTVSQPSGYLSLKKSLVIPNSTDSTLGVIFKGADRFIHNYSPYGADGYNTFMGINSGNFTMTGGYNVAIGDQSLFSNMDGYGNTTLGFQSLYSNTTGFQNTAVGLGSLQNNTTAYNNTAVGYLSLNASTTGYENTALGLASLQNNTTGIQNTAVGSGSLQLNIDGYENTAVGVKSSFSNTIGYGNTAIGPNSLYSNSRGFNNTAVGVQSLFSNAGEYFGVGSWNTALGFSAGSTIITGFNLTCLGNNAQPTSGTAVNQITLGNSAISSLRCNVTTITALSDARDKKNIKDLNLGIDFLMKIKPRQFNWDKREWYENNKSDGSKMNKVATAGFIAQEFDKVQTSENAEWLNLVLKDNPEKLEATPGNLLPIMVKAIQDLKNDNDELKTTTVELKVRLTKFEQMHNMLVNEIEKLKTNNEAVKVSLGEK